MTFEFKPPITQYDIMPDMDLYVFYISSIRHVSSLPYCGVVPLAISYCIIGRQSCPHRRAVAVAPANDIAMGQVSSQCGFRDAFGVFFMRTGPVANGYHVFTMEAALIRYFFLLSFRVFHMRESRQRRIWLPNRNDSLNPQVVPHQAGRATIDQWASQEGFGTECCSGTGIKPCNDIGISAVINSHPDPVGHRTTVRG